MYAYIPAVYATLLVMCQLPIRPQTFPCHLIFKISIEVKMLLCYIINTKEQSPTRWVDQKCEIEKSTPYSVKVLGWFFYVDLLTKRKNECKQCQKEKTKGH